jgi:hypothetical protein
MNNEAFFTEPPLLGSPGDSCRRTPYDGAAYHLIPLTKGRVTLVDAEDYDRLARHKWHAAESRGRWYAVRKGNGKTIRLHREVLNVPPGMMCDHRNHDGLDNRKCNLRICTASQNGQNRRPLAGGTSRYKGVRLVRATGKWRARICHHGRTIHIGCYDYEADAAIAYDDMAIELFGEFAYLNIQCRPEIKEWLDRTYFFPPAIYDGRWPMLGQPCKPTP